MIPALQQNLARLRESKPLILNLCNHVTMEFVANSQLALGAAPIMSADKREFTELIRMSSAVYINIGTLDETFIENALYAAQLAKHGNIPIVLDPVGAGATRIRTQTALTLAPYADIIRGNASEIIALAGEVSHTKGVESQHSSDDAKSQALALAALYQNCICVSGAIDFVCDTTREASIAFGSALMPLVTGMGCSLTGLLAAFRATIPDTFDAAYHGALYVALCGSAAAQSATSPAAFKQRFLDCLYEADFNELANVYA